MTVLSGGPFFQSYLFSFLFWFGIAAGALGLLLLHQITGGAWGDLIRPMLIAAAKTLPWLGLLFVPIAVGFSKLYPWARADELSGDPLLQHQRIYLNGSFFIARAAFYFLTWSFLATRLERWILRSDAAGTEFEADLASRRSAPGLVLYMFTLTFALIDWMMSLEPHWLSTIYPVMVMMGQVLTAIAFMICVLRLKSDPRSWSREIREKPFLDLGNMMLAFVMLWAYTAFSQYLIIWCGNLPDEIAWYLPRQQGGWFWVAMALVFFQFMLPFLVLLGRRNKEKLERLVWIAVLILAMNAVNLFWLVEPPLRPSGPAWRWTDAALFLAIGVLWLGAFDRELRRQPSPVGIYVPESGS